MDREDLLGRIREVFPNPVWPKDKLAAIGGRGDPEGNSIIRHDQGKRWMDLTREELEWMSQHASAFSEEALVFFFFPAWLAAAVPDPDHAWQVELVSTCLLPSAPECFTLEQRRVPHDALAFVYVPEGEPTDWNSPNLLFLKLAPSYKEVGQEI